MQSNETYCEPCTQYLSEAMIPKKNVPKVSLGFIYQISLQLKFPFQSIALLTDLAIWRGADSFTIRIDRTQDDSIRESTEATYEQKYVEIKFNGRPFDNKQFYELASNQPTNLELSSKFMELKIAMMSLGKIGVLVSCDRQSKKIVMISVDDRINPNFSREGSGLYYEQSIVKGTEGQTPEIYSIAGKHQKKLISQALKIFHHNPQQLLNCPEQSTKIMIFHPKIFITSNKAMFYEISSSNFNHDIDSYHNSLKVQFLDKLGYQLHRHAQICLSGYYSLMYLKQPLKMRIGDSEQQLQVTRYQDYLKQLQLNNVLTKIQSSKFIYGANLVEIYEIKGQYFSQNNGILLYSGGRLINRFKNQFGKMFEQLFYKKKYQKPAKNIWTIVGVIQLNKSLIKPNLLKNGFEMTFSYRKFIKSLYLLIENLDRKNNAIVIGEKEISDNSDEFQNLGDGIGVAESMPRKMVKIEKIGPDGKQQTLSKKKKDDNSHLPLNQQKQEVVNPEIKNDNPIQKPNEKQNAQPQGQQP